MAKPVEWRTQARHDVSDASLWYAREGGLALGERFLSQLEATLLQLSQFPDAGSTRHDGIVPGLPVALQFFPVTQFERFLVYYLDLPDHVEVIRIWHSARGLTALFNEDD